jgi:hypothetical protein
VSERTALSLEKIDQLLPILKGLTAAETDQINQLLDQTEHLRRAVASFHMEAIRFRMHSVDRLIKATGDDPRARQAFDELRHALETAGFHTRSHTAPT